MCRSNRTSKWCEQQSKRRIKQGKRADEIEVNETKHIDEKLRKENEELKEILSLLSKQVEIVTNTLVRFCDRAQDEKERKAIVEGIEKVKEVEKEK